MPFYPRPLSRITRLHGHIVRILYVFAQFPTTLCTSARERANCLWEIGRGWTPQLGQRRWYTRRLGCRFIGRKILDLLISLVRHVGFVLLPVGISLSFARARARDFSLYSWADFVTRGFSNSANRANVKMLVVGYRAISLDSPRTLTRWKRGSKSARIGAVKVKKIVQIKMRNDLLTRTRENQLSIIASRAIFNTFHSNNLNVKLHLTRIFLILYFAYPCVMMETNIFFYFSELKKNLILLSSCRNETLR